MRYFHSAAALFISIFAWTSTNEARAQSEVHGAARLSCSPTDGPAIRLTFTRSTSEELVVLLNVDVGQAVGKWNLGRYDASGGLWMGACSLQVSRCQEAKTGRLVIHQVKHGVIEGQWEVQVDSAPIENQKFKAKLVAAKRPMCG